MLYALYVLALNLARALPLKAGYAVAELVARGYCALSKKDKTVIKNNLRVILGDDAEEELIERCVFNVFKNFAKYLVDFFRISKFTGEYINKNVEIEGIQHLDRCLSEGKGVICLGLHLGSWELGGALLGALGYPANAIVLEHKDERINDIFKRQRAINDLKAIPLGMSLKRCFKVLRSNELLAIAGDKAYTSNGEYIKFFGRRAFVPKGAAAISLKTGAPIVVCCVARKEDDTFVFEFKEPIRPVSTGDEKKDISDLMRRYFEKVEEFVRRYPDQWYVFTEIWNPQSKTQ